MNNKNNDIEKQIIEVLDAIRPYLNSDGGDVEFVKYEDTVVYIKLMGACQGCPHRNSTIQNGILEALQEAIPSITDVKQYEE